MTAKIPNAKRGDLSSSDQMKKSRQRGRRAVEPRLPIITASQTQPHRHVDEGEYPVDGAGKTASSKSSKSIAKREVKVNLKPRASPKPKSRSIISSEPILSISASPPSLENMKLLSPEFFLVDALDLAPRLLGKFLRKDNVVLQITEVEAYRPNDSACHGRFGITPRTAPVFGPGGHAYVYLCYGLHIMLNIVADKEGVGDAVLIRSCAPVSGLEIIQQRRRQITNKPILLAGPGKVGQALGLSTEWSSHPLYTPGGLELLDGPEPEHLLIGPRVGIQYALPEHANALWRFAIAGNPWISAPRNTLRPS